MRVIIGESVYRMTGEQTDKLLMVARKRIKSGIYAVEKDGVVELKKEKYKTETGLRNAVRKYEKLGFKVFYNEITG